MVSKKAALIILGIALFLLLASLFINMNVSDEKKAGSEVYQGTQQGSINLVINKPVAPPAEGNAGNG